MNVDQVNLPNVDLNLLKIFVTIMNEKSITGAGTRLGLTQSATSNALNRLRAHCQDPLFVRTSTGMEPTPFAAELFEPVSAALETIRQTFEQRTTFDPATSTRTFRIIQNNFGELQLLPSLVERLQSRAPHVRIVSLTIAREQYREALEDSTADLGVGRLPPGQFVQRHLYEDSLVCLMRREHPINGALTLERFLSTPQLAFSGKEKPSSFYGTPLESYLQLLGCDSVIVTGTTTSGCVRATVLDAFSLNFRPVVVEDACFDRSQASHAINLCDMNAKYANVLPSEDVLAHLETYPAGQFELPTGAGVGSSRVWY